MHRRDYILIAKCLRKATKRNSFESDVIDIFITALKEESPSFNETKFRDYIEKGE